MGGRVGVGEGMLVGGDVVMFANKVVQFEQRLLSDKLTTDIDYCCTLGRK